MKYMDYAAMGAALSASQRASEAFDEIERLQKQIDAIKRSAWEDREFQKWIEEFIYQFGKITERIETNPGEPGQDFLEIGAFLKMIEEKQINTSAVSGLENKKVFEDHLTRAEELYGDLWKHPRAVEERKEARDGRRLKAEKIRDEQKRQKLKKLKKNGILIGIGTGIIGFAVILYNAGGAAVAASTGLVLVSLIVGGIIWGGLSARGKKGGEYNA